MFELNQQAILEHVNTRRGLNDDSPVAVDLKFSLELFPVEAIAAAVYAKSGDDVVNAFYAKKKGALEPRFMGVKAVPIESEWEGKHEIKVSGLKRLRCAKLRKISFWAIGDGKFAGTFTVAIEAPPAGYIDAVADKTHRNVKIEVVQDGELPFPDEDEGDAEDAGSDTLDQQEGKAD